jgi:predicted transporter
MEISSAGLVIHAAMALLLIGVGIYTSKNWYSGRDVSHRTFALMSIPCPVCLAALFISIMLLGSSLEVSTAILGFIVGLVFFVAVIVSSLTLRKFEKGPETLGNLMTFLGIFYLFGAIIAPAYLHAKQTGLPEFTGPEVELLPFVVFAVLILLGYGLDRIKTQH